MKLAIATLLAVLLPACFSTRRTEIDFVRPANAEEVQFAKARKLALAIYRLPGCRAAFRELPDWPPGAIPFLFAELEENVRASITIGSRPVARLDPDTIRLSGVERLALTLIHEAAHRASYSQILRAPPGPKNLAERTANEELVRQVTAICAWEARIQ